MLTRVKCKTCKAPVRSFDKSCPVCSEAEPGKGKLSIMDVVLRGGFLIFGLWGALSLQNAVVGWYHNKDDASSAPPAIAAAMAAPAPATSDIPTLPDSATTTPDAPQTSSDFEEDRKVMDDCFFMVSPEVKALIDKLKACDIKTRIRKHDSSALSVIPAQGYKDGVAGVFKAFRLHINQNMEVACDDHHLYDADPQPGCMITVYVSRVRPSGKYSELAGWRASWFRGINEKAFYPVTGFAKYLSTVDTQILNFGGFVDTEDRP